MNHTFRWGWPLNFKFHVVNICLAYNISYSGQYYDWEKQVTRQPSFLQNNRYSLNTQQNHLAINLSGTATSGAL